LQALKLNLSAQMQIQSGGQSTVETVAIVHVH
jgi:hypothetical protein